MMKGYLDTGSGGATTVTVAGLPAGAYDVYVYADGDNGAASRTGSYRISGAGITTTTINLTDAGQYELQRGVHPGEQLDRQLREVQHQRERLHADGDAGHGVERATTGPGQRRADRAAMTSRVYSGPRKRTRSPLVP